MACSCSDETLAFNGCCCGGYECLPPEPAQGPQGPTGATGAAGADGADGKNSFTVSTDTFVVPAVGNNVAIPVAYGLWAVPGQYIFIQSAGVYLVVSTASTSITAQNTGATGNAAPTTVIATNRLIGPDGHAGALLSPLAIANGGTGQATALAAFNALSPLTTNGDTMVFEGGSNARKPIGTSGQIPVSNGTVWNWGTNAPAAANITGQVAVANGGTGASTASAARTALGAAAISANNTFNGTSNRFRLAAGASFGITDALGVTGYFLVDEASSSIYIFDFSGSLRLSVSPSGSFLSGFSQPVIPLDVVNTTPYTVAPSSVAEVFVSTYSTTGAQSITLPSGNNGRVIKIIDAAGNAGTNNITINRAGADTIMGATTYTISNSYGSVALIYVSTLTTWVILP